MFVFSVAAFLILVLWIAWKFQREAAEAIPVGVCILTLFLYLLAFFRKLSWCDLLSLLFLAGAGYVFWRASSERRRQVWAFIRHSLFSPSTLTALGMILVVTVCVSGKLTSWWDDYNFWTTDLKSIYYLNGFAEKYQNVAPEFGDYPPGTQMMKWWFAHLSPHQFREGLMFAGYYAMNLAFLVPFLKFLSRGGKKTGKESAFGISAGVADSILTAFLMVIGGIILWLFPAVAEAFWLDGCCADLTMALVYGAFLAAVADIPKKNDREELFFYYGREALYLAVLVLCKNTGFIWAGFGLLFAWGYHLIVWKKERAEFKIADKTRQAALQSAAKSRRRGMLAVTAAPVLVEGSWLGFCLLNRRVAKLTGAALHMVTGSVHIPAYQSELVSTYLEAFIKWPLHRVKTFALDLTPLALYLLILVLVLCLGLFRFLDKRQTVFLGCFLAFSGAIFYEINLLSHLTIFATETQYLEPFAMVSSIERYGAPFTIGALYLLAYRCLEGTRQKGKGWSGLLICGVFVLLTTDYAGAWRALWSYRENTAEIRKQREDIIDDKAEAFLEQVGTGRVLYLRDIGDVSWVRNTYISFEAAPVSVMYGNVDAGKLNVQEVVRAVREAHAGYLYVDKLALDRQELWSQFLPSGEMFTYGCLYRAALEGENLTLTRYEPEADG